MRHLYIGSALLVSVALEVIFVEFSETPSAALVFAVLVYLILLLLSGASGGLASGGLASDGLASEGLASQGRTEDGTASEDNARNAVYVASYLFPLRGGPVVRVAIAALIPVGLLLLLAFIPELDDPLDPSETVQLGSTFAVFWLLMSLALVGAVLGFLRPNSGALDAVMVGGAVILAQSLLSWTKADASLDALQLALYTYMVWVSICLIGAWVGLTLRQIGDSGMTGDQSRNPVEINT